MKQKKRAGKIRKKNCVENINEIRERKKENLPREQVFYNEKCNVNISDIAFAF